MLDYHSDCTTFALSFSPLSDSTANLKLAVGSFVEHRGETNNNLTVVGLDPSFLDLEDDEDDTEGYARSSRTGALVQTGSAFQPLARAPHPYPPSALAFSPARLSSSLQSSSVGTAGDATREMVASSSECLRLWDLVGDEAPMGKPGQGGFVGAGRGAAGSRLVQRAMLANVSAWELSCAFNGADYRACSPSSADLPTVESRLLGTTHLLLLVHARTNTYRYLLNRHGELLSFVIIPERR